MDLAIQKEGNILFLRPGFARLDTTTSLEFKGECIDAIDQEVHYGILNLSNVEFVDSSGLGTIIQLLKIFKKAGGNLILCNVRPPVMSLFTVSRIESAFVIVSDEARALASINKA